MYVFTLGDPENSGRSGGSMEVKPYGTTIMKTYNEEVTRLKSLLTRLARMLSSTHKASVYEAGSKIPSKFYCLFCREETLTISEVKHTTTCPLKKILEEVGDF